MSILNIRKAERAGARIVIGLDGPSGSGKTYSALQLAWGLSGGKSEKVGLLDTENKRGSLYAEILKGSNGEVHQFLIGDLDTPHSPQRYINAIDEFQKAGVSVLVIDSVTHEWEGVGGCTEIADANTKNGWIKAKKEHKRFMNALLQSDMHIICCIRSRDKVEVRMNGGKQEYVNVGMQPVQEKNFMFELTASITLAHGGQSRNVVKAPSDLIQIFGNVGQWNDGYITPSMGLSLKKWIDGGTREDNAKEKARNKLRTITEQGSEAVYMAFDNLTADEKAALSNEVPADILASAIEYDKILAAASNESDLNDELA